MAGANAEEAWSAEEARFAAFCQAQHPRLVGALTLYVGDREVALDLAQETLARVWRDWHRLGDVRSLEGYAYRAAMNLARNHFRWRDVRRRHRDRLAAEHPVAHHDADAADAVAVRAAVASLPHRKRAALVLRYFADRSVAETAAVMDLPENTVKSLTRRALADLRGVLGPTTEEVHDVH